MSKLKVITLKTVEDIEKMGNAICQGMISDETPELFIEYCKCFTPLVRERVYILPFKLLKKVAKHPKAHAGLDYVCVSLADAEDPLALTVIDGLGSAVIFNDLINFK